MTRMSLRSTTSAKRRVGSSFSDTFSPGAIKRPFTCWGVCLVLFMGLTSCPRGRRESHMRWTDFRGAGQYNKEGVGPTQYMCLHPLGPWAELLRGEDRRQPG